MDARALGEATVKARELWHGASSWKILVLPRTDTLPLAAWQVVRRFWEAGGAVAAVGAAPRNSESEFPSPTVEAMFAEMFTGKENRAGGVGFRCETPISHIGLMLGRWRPGAIHWRARCDQRGYCAPRGGQQAGSPILFN
ncbi:MAG: hypothetical protein K9N23_20040 [Akkermansiaceae bacterium]|nr:hypothetical protein [Akkermansiaceae bacterium]